MKNILAFLTAFKAKKARLDKLTEEYESMKKEIESYTMENNTPDENGKYKIVVGQYTITISPVTRTDIDKKRLEQELPDVAKEYEKISTYNRTIVK